MTIVDEELQKVIEANHHDPFSVLGRHRIDDQTVIRVLRPHTKAIKLADNGATFERLNSSDLFEWRGDGSNVSEIFEIEVTDNNDQQSRLVDAYIFGPQIPEFDLYLFGEGKHWHIYRFLGANPWRVDGVDGVLFATWAPNASRVSVVGDFNHWDGRVHGMRSRGGSGVWEIFIPALQPGCKYKFEVKNNHTNSLVLKSDPYAKQFEIRPSNASVVTKMDDYQWQDQAWMSRRSEWNWMHNPVSIYEVHLGSWRRQANGDFVDYRTLAHQLVDHVNSLGFTHIELLPITEHPLDASWGYQTLGYFAPTTRFGEPDDFRYFVDHCHQNGIGVLLDWVPAHFPMDEHGLAKFDGTALYEHADPRRGEHRDWGTHIYNYGRNEVKNFLLASANYWLEEYHLDGLRVDAVASMLYLDYSREAGDWLPNIYGGRENLEAIDFIRELNSMTHSQHPGTVVMAEESTAWPQVSRPTHLGGLGFSMKWNMGWMHDTLEYMKHDPVHRHYQHDQLTFGLLYAFTENFILPLSHDEVVHGKGSLRYKMPGDEWQQFANLRLLYTYMFTYPGKKLLFMGAEFAQGPEWNFDQELDWYVLEYPLHQGMQNLVRDVCHLYQNTAALHYYDFEQKGFDWIDCHDATQSVISYLRKTEHETVVVILNFTPVVRENYRIGVPHAGHYREMLNSDSEYYGGSNIGNGGDIATEAQPAMGHDQSITLTLPPLAGLVLKLV
jgi:1,4-alpha-glucan branching enzyme